jgi:hypothetical protein
VPDKKITDLVDGAPLQPTDEFVVARAGDNFKIDGAEVVAAVTKHDVTISGNTAGALAAISSGTMTLAGGNNITLSQAGNAVTVSALASSSLSATGAVSISTNGSTISIGAPTQTVQTQNLVALTLDGNTDGVLALASSGTVTLAGGNNITLSQAGNAITISGANVGGAQTGISGVVASDATYTSGTVTFTGVGGGVTVNSNTGQRIDISVAAPVAQSVQTQNMVAVTLSGNTSGAQALISSGTLTLAGGNNITVSQAGNAVTISGPNVGGAQTGISGIANSQTTYTSGTVSLSELGAITIRSTTGNQFQFSVNPQSTQVETQTFVAGIIASDTTYTSGNVRFTGVGGGITVSSNTGQRVDLSVAAQTNQAGSVYAISNTSGTSSGTYDARTLSIAGAGMITVAASNSGWRINATQSVQPETQTAISGIANSQTTYTSGTVSLSELGAITIRSTTGNQFQLSVNAQTTQTQGILSIGVSNVGNTSGNTTVNTGSRLVFAGGNNITVSQGTAAGATTITISAPNLGAGAFSGGASNLGNTAGDTGITGTRLILVGSNNITLSQATDAGGGTLSIIGGGGGGFSGGVSTGGNTAGATGITGTQNVFVGVTPISLSQTTGANGGTISINAPATSSLSATGRIQISTNGSTISIGDGGNTVADWQNFAQGEAQLLTLVAGISKTPFYWHDSLPGRITANSLAFKVSFVTANTLASLSAHLGVYTFVNSTSMALLGSHSEAFVVSSATSASFSGVRHLVMTGIGTHTALSVLQPGEYAFGMMFSAGATQSMNFSLMGASTTNGPLGLILPGTNNVSAGTSQGVQALWGRGSTTVNAMPANVVRSELVNQGSGASVALHPWIYIRS